MILSLDLAYRNLKSQLEQSDVCVTIGPSSPAFGPTTIVVHLSSDSKIGLGLLAVTRIDKAMRHGAIIFIFPLSHDSNYLDVS